MLCTRLGLYRRCLHGYLGQINGSPPPHTPTTQPNPNQTPLPLFPSVLSLLLCAFPVIIYVHCYAMAILFIFYYSRFFRRISGNDQISIYSTLMKQYMEGDRKGKKERKKESGMEEGRDRLNEKIIYISTNPHLHFHISASVFLHHITYTCFSTHASIDHSIDAVRRSLPSHGRKIIAGSNLIPPHDV